MRLKLCEIAGSGFTRRKFDDPCLQALEVLRKTLEVKLEVMDWARS